MCCSNIEFVPEQDPVGKELSKCKVELICNLVYYIGNICERLDNKYLIAFVLQMVFMPYYESTGGMKDGGLCNYSK